MIYKISNYLLPKIFMVALVFLNPSFLLPSWASSSAKSSFGNLIFLFAVATSPSCFSHYLTVQAEKANSRLF